MSENCGLGHDTERISCEDTRRIAQGPALMASHIARAAELAEERLGLTLWAEAGSGDADVAMFGSEAADLLKALAADLRDTQRITRVHVAAARLAGHILFAAGEIEEAS